MTLKQFILENIHVNELFVIVDSNKSIAMSFDTKDFFLDAIAKEFLDAEVNYSYYDKIKIGTMLIGARYIFLKS